MHLETEDGQGPRRAITWRSVGLGLLAAISIVTITPYNDFVVNNSFIVGSYFPPILTVTMLALVLLVNGPLHKYAPRLALGGGELSVVMAIALTSCAIPSQGVLRSLAALPVAPFNSLAGFTGSDPAYLKMVEQMNLPPWLFAVESVSGAHRENVVTAYYARLQPGEPVPWAAWVRPAISWGIFTFAFLGAMVAMACIVRFQWAVNERLAFPIAQLQALMIEPPEKGRALNGVFSSRMFWIAVATVAVMHSSVALHAYFPKVPEIRLSYDLIEMFGDDPWVSLPTWIKRADLFYTLLGISYFTQTRVTFSLWGTAILLGLIRWPLTRASADLHGDAYLMQTTGAAFAFLGGVLWIGRHHWAVVWRAVIGRPRANDATGFFLRYRPAVILLVTCVAVMFAWLLVVGCSVATALICVATILTAHVVTTRVMAETGFAFLRINIATDRLIQTLPPGTFTPRDAFMYGASHYVYMQGARESAMGFSLNAIQVTEISGVSPAEKRRVPGLLFLTLVVGLAIGLAASLWCNYHYALPLDNTVAQVINHFGLETWPRAFLVELPKRIEQINLGRAPALNYSPWLHVMIGMGVIVVLQGLTWRFAAWPLMPVGYLMCTSGYVHYAWFSLAIGWLAKVVILRFGGPKLFNDLKPLFIGLIFGEAVSIGLWLLITLFLAGQGVELHITRFLPQ
ncbi:MAG TPA: DUF6785 family protein [Tepidisphaeraceae bacterium]